MKKYIQPHLNRFNVSLDKEIAAGLAGWLDKNTMNTDTITTCEFSYTQTSE